MSDSVHAFSPSNMTYATLHVALADGAMEFDDWHRCWATGLTAVLTGGEMAFGTNARDTLGPVVCRTPAAHDTTRLTGARLPPGF